MALRVVASPDRSAPVVTVGVYYQIGFRLEPQGRSGFAHLFEHMMFQGSENAGKMEHIRLINSSGGLLNGTTHYDMTNYFEAVPSNALERVLWLEADRMRALKVDDENLRNQRDVVKEEVRVNVMNQPYGGFPWLDLPPVAFRNWPNAHNFYGDFADLDAATLADVQNFFRTYYAPNNAVLLMLGDLDAAEAFALAKRYFEDIPAGPPHAARRRDRAAADGRAARRSRGKIRPAAGHRHRLHVAAARNAGLVCGRHPRSRPARRTGGPGPSPAWCSKSRSLWMPTAAPTLFDTNGPTQMVSRIFHKPEFTSDATIAVFDRSSTTCRSTNRRRRTRSRQSEVPRGLLLDAGRRHGLPHAPFRPHALPCVLHAV